MAQALHDFPPSFPAAPSAVRLAQRSEPSADQQTSTTQLPNNASSIMETYGDWTVSCRLEAERRACLMAQGQGSQQSGQRRFAIEMKPAAEGKTEGTILMPFGLKFDAGAILKLDDRDFAASLRFSTCIAQGCLLPVLFQASESDALRKGARLTVAALDLAANAAVVFNVSLDGFSAAADRIQALSK
jgi:invasion protein IalB